MKFLVQIWILFLPAIALGQMDTSCENLIPEKMPESRPELLSGGCIDIVQNGQMNASARLFRLYIGEPGKFQLPVSVYTGVSANNFSNNSGNDDMLLTLIDPTMGIFNLCLEGNSLLIGRKKG